MPRVLLVLLVFYPLAGYAQHLPLVERYHQAREQFRLTEVLRILGSRIPPRPPWLVLPPPDSVERWMMQASKTSVASDRAATRASLHLGMLRWEKVDVQEVDSFLIQFPYVEWVSSPLFQRSPVDTLPTPWLRARLEELFGSPTWTIVEEWTQKDTTETPPDIEFEYWFVINRKIPFVVMDVAGPFERGLVFVGRVEDKDILHVLKEDLVQQLLEGEELRSYADVYFNFDRQAWYLTGYDGQDFFTTPISPPEHLSTRPAPGSYTNRRVVPWQIEQ